jgi:hypothetical protein
MVGTAVSTNAPSISWSSSAVGAVVRTGGVGIGGVGTRLGARFSVTAASRASKSGLGVGITACAGVGSTVVTAGVGAGTANVGAVAAVAAGASAAAATAIGEGETTADGAKKRHACGSLGLAVNPSLHTQTSYMQVVLIASQERQGSTASPTDSITKRAE